MKIQISIVICTLNRAELLRKCLASVLKQSLSASQYEIIVVDNGSTDSTRAVCKEYGERIRYVYEPINGLSQARNTGWKIASAPYVGYLDDDATASSGWVESALSGFRESGFSPAWVAGPIQLEWEVPEPQWMTSELRQPLGEFNWGQAEPGFLAPGKPVGGGNSFYKRDFLETNGGFDTALGRQGGSLLSGEETQLQHKLAAMGQTVFYHPGVLVYHFVAKERCRAAWFYRRYYWGGRSDAAMRHTLSNGYREGVAGDPSEWAGQWCRVMGNMVFALGLGGARRAIWGRIYLAYAWGWLQGNLFAK